MNATPSPVADTAANSSVSMREISIRYGETTVLDSLDLDVNAGEFLVLLGPSGCGKSTLLNAIAGLGEISDGEIWIAGRNVTWDEPSERGIGMVFQSYALYPQMTVKGNMSFGLRMAKVPKPEIERRVTAAADILQLTQLLNRKPAALSGGQRQRVAIGRALVRDAAVYLFDEPLSNLDAKLRGELRVELKRIHQELRKTMIYVTHDQVEALTLADRIAIMKGGVIQQLGTPAEVYRQPENLFVAGFIGTPGMNFIKGSVFKTGAGTVFRSETGAIEVALDAYQARQPIGEQSVILGIRPEHIALAPAGSTEGTGFRVSVVEPMGSETIIYGDAGGIPMTLRVDGDTLPEPKTELPVILNPSRINLFDEKTGKRL